jgi:hypothetical protein
VHLVGTLNENIDSKCTKQIILQLFAIQIQHFSPERRCLSVCLDKYVTVCSVHYHFFPHISHFITHKLFKIWRHTIRAPDSIAKQNTKEYKQQTRIIFLSVISSYLKCTGILTREFEQFGLAVTLWNFILEVTSSNTGRPSGSRDVIRGFPRLFQAISRELPPLRIDSFLSDTLPTVIRQCFYRTLCCLS